jgi:glycosyltransferase involved in cell wall biosynthesis
MLQRMATRVTWMIPVLNGMPYLPITLASIEAQTYRHSEIVVWDNGSTDGTVEEATRWIPSRIPGVVVTGQPLPLGLARAAMVSQCKTEFGALIDADDVNEPQRLERQMQFMAGHPEVAVVGTQLRQINSAGEDMGPFTDYPLTHEQILAEMLRSNPIGQPAVLFRCAAVLAAGNYRDFSPTHVEDYDLWLRMAAMNFRMANLPDALVRYRVHERSTTQKSIAANRLDAEMLRRLQEAAPALYGVDGETIARLKMRRQPDAISTLSGIARHVHLGERPFRSSAFYAVARQMISPSDLSSRVRISFAASGAFGIFEEIGAIAADLVRFPARLLRKVSGH